MNTSTVSRRRDWVAAALHVSPRLRLKRVTRGIRKANAPKEKRKYRNRIKAALFGVSSRQPETQVDAMLQTEVITRDPDRPRFHVMPLSGWLNDPNGPIYYQGRYHLFYQHVPNRVEWDWGLVWGHAYSEDLLTWEHLPIALEPSRGGYDSDGCFSGTCIKNGDGIPTILYTGVKLRSNHTDDLPPPEADLNLPFIETQLAAIAEPALGDELMLKWNKVPKPILHHPPLSAGLTGWRDPFIFRKGDSENSWLMLIGSGIKGTGGTVLKYTADDILSDWKFDGYLCTGDADTGAMWECPLLQKLKPYRPKPREGGNGASKPVDITSKLRELSLSQTESYDDAHEQYGYFFCVSPDAPSNPVFYWLGQLDEQDCFQLEQAKKYLRLDLGDILYAPNLMEDENGDTLLWAWLQERRTVGSYDYSGCLSVPRKLTLKNGKLFQEPADRIAQLRSELLYSLSDIPLFPEETIPIEDVRGQALDIELTLEKGSSEAAGLMIRSWRVGGEGTAAIVFDWERSCLEVVFEALNPDTMEFFLDAENSRRIGGSIDWHPGQPLQLRIILDHSCLEIFTGSGEVLSTRVYRGAPFQPDDSGLDFISFGGTASLISAEVHGMQSIWKEDASLSPVATETSKEVPLFGMPELELHPTLAQPTTQPMN